MYYLFPLSTLEQQPQERAELKKETNLAIRGMRRSRSENELYDSIGESSRGLEHLKSSAILEQLRQNQEDVVHAVLRTQERQGRRRRSLPTGFHHDDNAIAAASSKFTKWARDRATLAGAADAAAVAAMEFDTFVSGSSAKRSPSPTFSRSTMQEKRLKKKSLALREAFEMNLIETMSR